jgi:hypothetical protein
MKNFRIIENKNVYYIQYQFMNRWFYCRGLNDYGDEYTNSFNLLLLLPLVFIPFFQIDNELVIVIAITLFIVSCILTILGIFLLLDSKKKVFYSKDAAVKWIKKLENYEKEKKEMQKIKDMIEKKEKKKDVNKLVGVYYNGELIDGPRLERWKKLEKIVGDDDKIFKV